MEGSREILGVAVMGALALAVGLTEAALAQGSQSASELASEKVRALTHAVAISMGLQEGQVAEFFLKGDS